MHTGEVSMYLRVTQSLQDRTRDARIQWRQQRGPMGRDVVAPDALLNLFSLRGAESLGQSFELFPFCRVEAGAIRRGVDLPGRPIALRDAAPRRGRRRRVVVVAHLEILYVRGENALTGPHVARSRLTSPLR